MGKLKLKQLSQSDAIDNQTIQYNSSTGLWESSNDIITVPSGNNKAETPSANSGDDQNTSITIDDTPYNNGNVSLSVNGVSYVVGDGVNNKHCYFSNGLRRKYIDFDGTDDYVTMGDALDFDRTDPFSLSVWINPAISGDSCIPIGKQLNGTPYRGYIIYVSSNYVGFYLRSTYGSNELIMFTADALIVNNTWQHIVCTWDGDNSSPQRDGIHIYVNGVDQTLTINTDNLGSNTLSNAASFNICARNNSVGGGSAFCLDGGVMQAAVYSKELTSNEVSWIYNGGEPRDLTDSAAPSNLAAYWKMGEGDTYPTLIDSTGTTAYPTLPDSSGNNYNGTLTNMSRNNIVAFNDLGSYSTKYLDLDGVDDYVTMGNVLDFDRTDPFSLSCWMKRKDLGESAALMSKQLNSSPHRGYMLDFASSGYLRIYLRNTSGSSELTRGTSTYCVADTNWHHVVFTWDGDSTIPQRDGIHIYVDGVDQPLSDPGSDTLGSNTLSNAASFCMSARNNSSGGGSAFALDGFLGDAAVYNKELSSTEVSWIYNNGEPRDLTSSTAPSNLVAYWRPTDIRINGTMTNMASNDIITDSNNEDRDIVNIESGDKLFWNGNISGFDLEAIDKININYNVISVGGTSSDSIPGFTFVEKKSITSATDSVVFSGLDGDTDEIYVLIYRLINDDIFEANYSLEPNQSASNCYGSTYSFTGSADTGGSHSDLRLGSIDSGEHAQGKVTFYAKKSNASTDMRRLCIGEMTTNSSSALTGYESTGMWNDISNNLTSLEIVSSEISGIGQGSEFILYKMVQI